MNDGTMIYYKEPGTGPVSPFRRVALKVRRMRRENGYADDLAAVIGALDVNVIEALQGSSVIDKGA